jgi:hypothetical protein
MYRWLSKRLTVVPATAVPVPVGTIVAAVPVAATSVKHADPRASRTYDNHWAVGSAEALWPAVEACPAALAGFCRDDCQRAGGGDGRNGQYNDLLHHILAVAARIKANITYTLGIVSSVAGVAFFFPPGND